jgi:phytoene dehydrogenase-like protein
VATAARHRLRGARSVLAWARRSLLDVLGSFGLPPWIVAAAHTGGPAVWGLPPDHPGTGLGALGLAMRHLVGVGRPVGGSGALPDALAAYVRAHGGTIVTSAEVNGLVIEAGRVRGVRLADGAQVSGDAVVAATDPQTVMDDWTRRWPTAEQNGYESKVDAVVTSLPRFHAVPEQLHGIATTLVCPTPELMVRHLDRVSDPPMFLVNTPSVLDGSMRPSPGSHLLSLEVLWTPYALRGGWDGSPQPWRWLEQLASICAPGLLEGIRDWRVMTPPDYEREFSLRRGYAPSFPGGVLDALLGRRRELTRYTTDVPGLYLTGAGTFPGAGVWGVSGRNAAATVTRSVASAR